MSPAAHEKMISFRLCGKDASSDAPAFLVHSMRGEEAIGSLFEYRIKLIVTRDADAAIDHELDSRTDIAPSSLLNKEVSLRVPLDLSQSQLREFNGLVAGVRLVDNFSATPQAKWFYYEVSVRPRLWLLCLSSHCRVFSKMTVLDIVKRMLDEAAVDHEIRCRDSYAEMELCVQYNETDFDFLCRLLSRAGIYYYFVHKESKHIMVISDAAEESALLTPNPHEAVPSVPYQYAIDENFHPGIYQWHDQESLVSNEIALSSYDFKAAKTNHDHGLKTSISANPSTTSLGVHLYAPHYKAVDDGERLAKAYLEWHQSQSIRIDAEGNMRNLSAGGLFTLIGGIRQDQNCKYLVTRASYTVNAWLTRQQRRDKEREQQELLRNKGDDDYLSIVQFRRKYQTFTCHLEAAPYDKGFRPFMPHTSGTGSALDRSYVRPPLLQTATVIGVEDREVDADCHTRIKVKFHWEDADTEKDAGSRPGIRLGKPWAGSRFGVHTVPRIGQEVIVAFMDVDEPIIVGSVDNQANMPPHDASRFPAVSTIRTQSIKHENQYSELRFHDDFSGDTVQTLLHTTGQYDHRVGKNKLTWVEEDAHLIVKGSQRLKAGAQDLIVEKDQRTQVHGKVSLTVNGAYVLQSAAMSLHGDGGITLRSNDAM